MTLSNDELYSCKTLGHDATIKTVSLKNVTEDAAKHKNGKRNHLLIRLGTETSFGDDVRVTGLVFCFCPNDDITQGAVKLST